MAKTVKKTPVGGARKRAKSARTTNSGRATTGRTTKRAKQTKRSPRTSPAPPSKRARKARPAKTAKPAKTTSPAKATKPTTRTPRTTKRAKPTAAAAAIQSWSTDPLGGLPPLQLPVPVLPGATLATHILDVSRVPPPQVYGVGTPEFRYWTAAESLRRAADFWVSVGPAAWNPSVGASLPVRLDDGVDLNAYYARTDFPTQDIKQGLSFFHDTVRDATTGANVTVFSGESPDIVGHELGHAVLDALKPALWDVASTEAAAFHESFGDMSAILSALQLVAVRQAVLEETAGRLWRNSSVSRVAEQLGYAIRQRSPDAVDADSLRNAANGFVYADPLTLPPSGPATTLTRAPHNFSRIFTGAFLEALGGMIRALDTSPDADVVLEASLDMGRLLARAVVSAPVRTDFLPAVAEQLVLADGALFDGKYGDALTTALVRRGLLALRSLASPAVADAARRDAPAAAARFAARAAGGATESGQAEERFSEPVKMALDGAALGLPVTTVYVDAPAIDDSTALQLRAGMAAREAAGLPRRHSAVEAFVEDLVLRGRVSTGDRVAANKAVLIDAMARKRLTHQLVRAEEAVELRRISFECSCGCGSH